MRSEQTWGLSQERALLMGLGIDPDKSRTIGHICTRCWKTFKTQEKFDKHSCPMRVSEIVREQP